MSTHPDPELLAALALGEDVPATVDRHLATCPDCRAEVAALTDARDLVRAPLPPVVPVRPGLRDAVLAAALDADADTPPAGFRGSGPAAARPPSSAVATADGGSPPDPPRARRRFGAAVLVAATVAGIVLGGVGGAVLGRRSVSPEPETVLARADLATLDSGSRRGSADLVRRDGVTDLSVRTGRMDADGGYLEVWLIHRDGTRMVAVGVLAAGSAEQQFVVPAGAIEDGYVVVDISREPFDGDARHSGVSLVQGTLT